MSRWVRTGQKENVIKIAPLNLADPKIRRRDTEAKIHGYLHFILGEFLEKMTEEGVLELAQNLGKLQKNLELVLLMSTSERRIGNLEETFQVQSGDKPEKLKTPHEGILRAVKAGSEIAFDIASFEPLQIVPDGESYITGEEFAELVAKLGFALDVSHAEIFLRDHEQIPREWERFNFIFPGATTSDSLGASVLKLRKSAAGEGKEENGGWVKNFWPLDSNMYPFDRLLVPKNKK